MADRRTGGSHRIAGQFAFGGAHAARQGDSLRSSEPVLTSAEREALLASAGDAALYAVIIACDSLLEQLHLIPQKLGPYGKSVLRDSIISSQHLASLSLDLRAGASERLDAMADRVSVGRQWLSVERIARLLDRVRNAVIGLHGEVSLFAFAEELSYVCATMAAWLGAVSRSGIQLAGRGFSDLKRIERWAVELSTVPADLSSGNSASDWSRAEEK